MLILFFIYLFLNRVLLADQLLRPGRFISQFTASRVIRRSPRWVNRINGEYRFRLEKNAIHRVKLPFILSWGYS